MEKRLSLTRRGRRLAVALMAAVTMVGGSLAVGMSPAHAANVVYACGYRLNVSMFGGAYQSMGCPPQTSSEATANSLSPALSASGQAYDGDGAAAVLGPATFFSSPYDANDNLTNSGALHVTASTGSTVSAMSRAFAVGPSPFWTKTPTSWQPSTDGTTGFVRASCSASSPTSRSSSVTIKNGVVDTSTDSQGYPATQVLVPESPPQNYRVNFTLDNIGDRGHMIFNEVIDHGNGSFTVNAAHMYMEGPAAVGDMVIGQVKCGK